MVSQWYLVKETFSEIMILLNDSNVKTCAMKYGWPFHLSYVRDISSFNSVKHSETMMSICFFSRTSIPLYFKQFARWRGHFKNKPFLVCHSHTPTDCMFQPQLSLTALNLFSVLWIGKSLCIKGRLNSVFLFIYIHFLLCNMSLCF